MRKPFTSKKLGWTAASFAAVFGLTGFCCPAGAAPAAGDIVQGLNDVLLSTVKHGRTLARPGLPE